MWSEVSYMKVTVGIILIHTCTYMIYIISCLHYSYGSMMLLYYHLWGSTRHSVPLTADTALEAYIVRCISPLHCLNQHDHQSNYTQTCMCTRVQA